ncbi:fungal-specific transcription factor domain-containing protein [Mycena galericulata]|nr:fungal-specific transcription factor domain-containing protein [Mycena galericulata]
MSSDGSPEGEVTTSKKKRVQRACDMCRRKKRRCDGGDKCDHCTKHNFVCTYIEPSTTRPVLPSDNDTNDPSSTRSYVESLENRLKAVEALLKKATTERSPGVQLVSNGIQRLNSPFPAPHPDDLTFVEIEESFRALSIDNTAAQGFHGKSSGAMLVKAAMDLKKNENQPPHRHLASWNVPITNKPWDAPVPAYSFPDYDLLQTLLRLYFDNVNAFLPLLHRPTFEAGVAQQFHLTHSGFAKTLLLVCAVGARYSTDPRVSFTDAPAAETAGWKWFDQVELCGHLVHTHPTLYDLQSYCLAAEFLDCTSSPRTCWTLVGFGQRLSQDIGAHRSKMRSTVATFEQELEKRASWILYLFDAQTSTALGRSIALQSHDFDLEVPIMCDDEYWVDIRDPPTPMFRQPADQPSRIAFFNCMLQLNRILSFSCKILYSTTRSKGLIGLRGDKWEEQVVVELDSALNTWFDTVPDHLRWNPDNPIQDEIFFDQSAVLYCMYYHTRIIIHRPFIPAMRRAVHPSHLPSLAICNNAARACSHVAQIQQQRRPHNPVWFSQTPLFTAGIVLLLNIWGGSGGSAGRIRAAERDLADVHRCIAVLDAQRQQWPSAGALLDTLRQLVAVDRPMGGALEGSAPRGLPLPPASIPAAPPSEVRFAEPPNPVALLPPVYDPRLETAPPPDPDFLDHNVWYNPDVPMPTQSHFAAPFPGPEGEYAASSYGAPDVGYGHQLQFPDNSMNLQLFGEDVQMDPIDLNTVELWSHAPTSFGVADWDMYLGQFLEFDGQSGQSGYP